MTAAKKTVQPEFSMVEILDQAISAKGKPKSGLGLVWGNTTQAIGDTAKVISIFASTGVELAVQAKAHAVIGKAESYKELLTTFGIEAEGAQAIVLAQKLMKVLEE